MVKGEKSLEHCNEKSNLKYNRFFNLLSINWNLENSQEKRENPEN